MRKLMAVVAGAAMLGSTGCALESTAAPVAERGAAVQGRVHGGQSAVVGSRVYLLAASTAGYGASSISLLTAGDGTDAIGKYVVSQAYGNFSISGDYTCTAGQQVYLLALGGNPGLSGNQMNAALAMMAVLGACPAAGNFAATVPFVTINEVTTVAAVYALSGFMTDATHVASTSTTAAVAGVANAFATAANLADIGAGAAYAVTPSTTTGAVPQAELNTLGNILQACVNSNGDTTTSSPASACYALFHAASGGVTPTNTVEAALSVAQHPGVNVGTLFGLAPASGAAFAPALSAAPNDWTVAVTYTSAAFGTAPVSVAVAGDGSVFEVAQDLNAVNKVSALGVPSALSPYTGFSVPSQVVVDSLGNAWVTNTQAQGVLFTNLGVTKLSASGAAAVTVTAGSIRLPLGVAIDGSDTVWTANQVNGGGNISHVSNAGGAYTSNGGPFGGTEEQGVQALAFDASGNLWTTTFYNVLNKVGPTGTLVSSNTALNGYTLGSLAIDGASELWMADPNDGVLAVSGATGTLMAGAPFTGGGFANATSLALDGAGNVWTASYNALTTGCTGQLSEMTKTGVAVSPSGGYTTPAMSVQTAGCVYSVAVDGAGDVWSAGPGMLTEFVGAAVPVHTPVVPTSLAVRP